MTNYTNIPFKVCLFKSYANHLILNHKYSSKVSSLLTHKVFINGKWVNSYQSQTFPTYNPSNGEILAHAADCCEKDAKNAITSAQNAFHSWSKLTGKERSVYIKRLFQAQQAHCESLARLISLEMGKPLNESRKEIEYGASFFDWFSEEAKRLCGDVIQSSFPNTMAMAIREPLGPVGIITPWNFPNAMITRKLGAALASGCTAVIRPAEDTPFSGLAIGKMVEEAKLPPGVVNLITSSRSQASMIGDTFCNSPSLQAISFTGSTVVGKELLKKSSSTVKRVSLELGGNAPFIVFNSADITKAVQGCLVAKFRNSGQTCISANRIFVQSKIYDQFIVELAQKMSQELKVGDPLDPSTTIGPLVNSRSIEKVKFHVKDAIEKGAKIILGGNQIKDNFFEPTLITNVTKDMQVCKEETFGPLAAVAKFETEKEVIEKANNTRFGLAGYFYSADSGQAWRVARDLQVGMVGINTSLISSSETPFGGMKESGLGREGSFLGIEEFTNVKFVAFNYSD